MLSTGNFLLVAQSLLKLTKKHVFDRLLFPDLNSYYKQLTVNGPAVLSLIECAALAKVTWFNTQPLTKRSNAFYYKDGKCWLALVLGSKMAALELAQPLTKSVDAAYALAGHLDGGKNNTNCIKKQLQLFPKTDQ
jgi:hypothetical protein